MIREIGHRGVHAAAGQVDSRQLQSHLAAGQGGQQGQVIAVAQMTDAEGATFDFSKSRAQRKIETLQDGFAQFVGVDAFGDNDAGQNKKKKKIRRTRTRR